MSKYDAMNLIADIYSGFSWRKRPQHLVVSNELDSSEFAVVEALSIKDWEDVNGDFLEKNFDVITLLSPEAFCYFLPGIMKASVEEGEPNLIVVTNLIGMLDRSPIPDWWDDFFLARWPKLLKSECLVLQSWLYWLAGLDERAVSDDSLERALQTIDLLMKKI